ncbi:MAG TPA: hypothetical protein VGG02_01350 [Chthoniobacterales bacterium]|jgi:hypothetical protein
MNAAVAKLEAQVDALEELTLRAFNRYLFLAPMLTSGELASRMNDERNGNLFVQLRGWLYWGLVQELAKICLDRDEKSPCISSIRSNLADTPGLLNFLEQKYTNNIHGIGSVEELRCEFQREYGKFDTKAQQLLESNVVGGYKTIRDKLISHNELRKQGERYQFHDVAEENLKYGDERQVLETLRELVILLLLLVKNADTNWDSYLNTTENLVRRFWRIEATF